VKDAIKYALSLGADEGVHVKGDGVALNDPLCVATVLAGAARKAGYDLILTGKQGVDHDWSQVGVLLAELLDLPHVSVIVKLEVDAARRRARPPRGGGRRRGGRVRPPRRADGAEGPERAALRLAQGHHGREEEGHSRVDARDLGVDPATVGDPRRPRGSSSSRSRRRGPRDDPRGEPQETARELVRLLREEAKVI